MAGLSEDEEKPGKYGWQNPENASLPCFLMYLLELSDCDSYLCLFV